LLRINSEWLTKEAYSADTRRLDIQLKADPSEVASGGFFVNQNQPNPFSSNTVVTYWLPEAAEVSFTLLNASGQELGHFTEQRKKGFGNWTIDKSTLDGAGIYYYMISTPFGTEVRKMVCVE
jgi:1,4-alpha-glucan branching enzyme